MRYDSGQYGSFDGLDNRKTVMSLFKRMGRGHSEEDAAAMRAGFLSGLIVRSTSGFAGRPMFVEPCSAVEAYRFFFAITGNLGVDVEEAAVLLERVIVELEKTGERCVR